MDDATKAKLREFRDLIYEKEALQRKEKATMAEMIRACLAAIRMDVQNYRCGHLSQYSKERTEQVRKNKQDQKKAFIYLEVLATMLEDQANLKPSDDLTLSNEGEASCISD